MSILYIEDDQGLWSLVEHRLKKQGIGLVGANTLAEAKNCILANQFDLILVDHELPDGTGLDLVKEYAAQHPCIMLTGVGSETIAVECLKAGARDYLIKDVQGNYLDILPQTISRVLKETKLERENKIQSELIRITQERLRAVFDYAPDLMLITDKNFNILDVSAITIEEYKATRESLQGQHLSALLCSSDINQLKKSDSKQFQVTLHSSVPAMLKSTRLGSGEFVIVFRNLTDQLEIQTTKEKLQLAESANTALKQANAKLQNVIRQNKEHQILGSSKAMQKVERVIASIAATDATALIHGETGTGKELVAINIAKKSRRGAKPLITLNCAAIPKDLVESELFGHEKGSFTGALKNHAGKFKQADGGTLFLDEIGELELDTQAKLLRTLQEGEVQPIGSQSVEHVDVRVIAATNRNLEQMVEEGKFRADLFYRLNVVPIEVPALRERKEDIPLLAEYFLQKYAERYDIGDRSFSDADWRLLIQYSWPGNVRELQNVVERFVVLGEITSFKQFELSGNSRRHKHQDLPGPVQETQYQAPIETVNNPNRSLEEIERDHIKKVLRSVDWVISGDKGAAKVLGLNPSTLRFRMQKLGITK